MSSHILAIETATDVFSVALWQNDRVVGSQTYYLPQLHAKLIMPAVDQLLKNLSVSPAGLSAVAVSGGPGSYTGLRIGVSAAKGLCFALGIPLIGVSTLASMAAAAQPFARLTGGEIVAMMDARRMEVYAARFSADLKRLTHDEPWIVTPESVAELPTERPLVFTGNGAAKCADLLTTLPGSLILTEQGCNAEYVARLAAQKFDRQDFENLLAYEPVYLKSFAATTPKPKL